MELVTNKIFYHIQKLNTKTTDNKFIVGNEYSIGDKNNPFYELFYHFGFDSVIDIPQMKRLISEYQLFSREVLFEEVRRESFPQEPSRQKCLWLIPKTTELKASLDFWQKAVTFANKENICEILKLSCTGNIFIADQSFLPKYFGHFMKYKENAYKYWNGQRKSANPTDLEVLFTGKIKVLAKFASIEDVN